ncbi:hypothetical protein QE152_g34423 [Popillia japonica]|uniref:Uncharacterized protein n=1 Tax=Popillia japonica TaxID=7064 RepID=A0AAW1ITR9_POPJA
MCLFKFRGFLQQCVYSEISTLPPMQHLDSFAVFRKNFLFYANSPENSKCAECAHLTSTQRAARKTELNVLTRSNGEQQVFGLSIARYSFPSVAAYYSVK